MSLDHLSPGARQIVQPAMTPCQQAQALNQKQLSTDAVKSLAHGLPEAKAVQWASASAEKVANPAHAKDFEAIQAAKAWCKNPTPETQQLAAKAASKAGHQTPGSWAAQAAAAAGSGGGLTQHAVSGAVLLAVAQGGKAISPSGMSVPKQPAAPIAPKAPEIPKANPPRFQFPFFKKPAPPTAQMPQMPEVPKPGADGIALTAAQRAEMAKHTEPFLKLGCDIGHGKA